MADIVMLASIGMMILKKTSISMHVSRGLKKIKNIQYLSPQIFTNRLKK